LRRSAMRADDSWLETTFASLRNRGSAERFSVWLVFLFVVAAASGIRRPRDGWCSEQAYVRGMTPDAEEECDNLIVAGLHARVTVFLIAASLAFATGVGSTDAARQPTFKEREALTVALPDSLLRYPVGCVWLRMSVSNNGRYARVEPIFLNATHAPCLQFASNGYW